MTRPVAGNDGNDDDAYQGIASIDQHCSVHATAVLFESPPQQPAALKANSGATAAQNFFWMLCHGALLGACLGWFYSIMDQSKLNPIPEMEENLCALTYAAGRLG